MASKAINIRLPEADQIKVTEAAKSVGMTVTEYVRFASLNIGKAAATEAVESAAFGAILERLDDLETRIGNPGHVPSNDATGGPSLADIGEAMTDLYAGQKRTQGTLERTDETLQNLTAAVRKIFDHLDRQAGQSAPPAAPRPTPTPTPPAAPKAESFRRCQPGTVFQEFRETDEQPRPSREDFYRRNLRQIVERAGWDSKVTPEQYAFADMTPPAGLYDQ